MESWHFSISMPYRTNPSNYIKTQLVTCALLGHTQQAELKKFAIGHTKTSIKSSWSNTVLQRFGDKFNELFGNIFFKLQISSCYRNKASRLLTNLSLDFETHSQSFINLAPNEIRHQLWFILSKECDIQDFSEDNITVRCRSFTLSPTLHFICK